ncbi:hypothetical protein NM688_g8626 [Phlebia brevispora]|uniref:Uncharacterized protein n=1 Tax=Phlebia brevispora TaxID=194682 RepID=A0ACC1RSB6_9APHY|nr:hypothetical protein NM688_g8626 [Phlebia brevispora]
MHPIIRTQVAEVTSLLDVQQDSFRVQENAESIWNKLPPSSVKHISWRSCYEHFYCARLGVPLDYASNGSVQASVAMIKLPRSSRTYLLSVSTLVVTLAAGGPGTSGVNFLLSRGVRIREVLGGGHDLISFDPRGVGRSTPRIAVFPDPAEEATWNTNSQQAPLPNMTADAISRIHARALVYNAIAETRLQGAADYVGTAAVARDMLNIVKAHGRTMLHFWGFSYGTIIGATFAAMFPHNVGRMVLDGTHWHEHSNSQESSSLPPVSILGVVDANNYYTGS